MSPGEVCHLHRNFNKDNSKAMRQHKIEKISLYLAISIAIFTTFYKIYKSGCDVYDIFNPDEPLLKSAVERIIKYISIFGVVAFKVIFFCVFSLYFLKKDNE